MPLKKRTQIKRITKGIISLPKKIINIPKELWRFRKSWKKEFGPGGPSYIPPKKKIITI